MSIITGRPRLLALALLAALPLAATALGGCAEDAECEDVRAKLLEAIASDCDVPTRCGNQADPKAPPPRVRYLKPYSDQVDKLRTLECDATDLGETPFFCASGFPACPPGYTCGDTAFSSNVCLKDK